MKKFVKKVATTALAATLALPMGVASAASFPDVNSGTVTPDVQQAIESLAAQGVIRGFPDGTFGPNKSITRAQFAKILAQVKELSPNPSAASHFTDVKDPEQQGWIGALYAAGLTTGTTATTYSPNQPVQRDQAATFIVRALGLTDVAQQANLMPSTTDGSHIHDSHRPNVGLLERIGLIQGYPNGSFGPGDPFKRQQAANLLYKVQQNYATYVDQAKALLNSVDVVHNEDGTVTVTAKVAGATKVDVLIELINGTDHRDKVVFEQKGVQANKDGVFAVTTTQRIIAPGTYNVMVTAYGGEDEEVAKLTKEFTVDKKGVTVKGHTEAPDLIQVYAEGKYVYFVFDEAIEDVEEDEGFYIVTFDGDIIEAPRDEVDVEDDDVTVKVEFYNEGIVAVATAAGVYEGAVSDKDGNENVDSTLPLEDVQADGTTFGPDLKSVKVSSFDLGSGSGNKAGFTVEYVFDEDVDQVVTNAAYNFILYLKDGTKLVGNNVKKVTDDVVEVEFDVERVDADTIRSLNADGTPMANTQFDTERYSGKTIKRDDVAQAAVMDGTALDDDTNPNSVSYTNPLTVSEARTKLSATYLRSAEIDFEDGEITYTFSRSVEDVVTDDVYTNFGVVTVDGTTAYMDASIFKDLSVERSKVTIELQDNEEVADLLAGVVGVAVKDIHISDSAKANERIVAGFAKIERKFAAGDIHGPVIKSNKYAYDRSDELLEVMFRFAEEVQVADEANAEDYFVLYNAKGEEVDFEIDEVEGDDEEVTVVFEINEDELKEVVLVAVKEGAVASTEKYRNGLKNYASIHPIQVGDEN